MTAKQKVLIVDDEPNFRKTMRIFLERLGMTVLEAGGGREGYEIFCSTEVDAIISDLRMPDGDGIELLEKVRAQSPHLLFCLITGNTDQGVASLVTKGASRVFSKPVELSELEAFLGPRLGLKTKTG